MAELHRRHGGAFHGLSEQELGPLHSLRAEELDALFAAQLAAESSSSDESGSASNSDGGDSDGDGDGGGEGAGRLPWALRNVPVLVSWASLAAVFALQPPGRRIPPTMDLAITTVRPPLARVALTADRAASARRTRPLGSRLRRSRKRRRAASAQAAFALEYNLLVFPLLAQLLSWLLRCAPS